MIDFVLPWVDGDDINWKIKKLKYSSTAKENSNISARFRDMGTLKYVLRAIELNCPWYNKIYVLTDGHYPKWLDLNSDKIVLLKHDDFYHDIKHLPTFNSTSIEMNLANIKGLSDKFVYLNDDFIILNPLEKERFFIDNRPVDFFSHGWLPRNKFFGNFITIDNWVKSLNNNINLINKYFIPSKLDYNFYYHKSYNVLDKISNFLLKNIYKRIFWIEHWHHPQPYLKKTLNEVFNRFSDEMMVCSSNRFRDDTDLNQYIYRYWHLINGDFHPYKYDDALVSNLNSKMVLDKLIEKINNNNNINFVCFNDDIYIDDKEYEKVKYKLLDFLEKKFRKKASFEL